MQGVNRVLVLSQCGHKRNQTVQQPPGWKNDVNTDKSFSGENLQTSMLKPSALQQKETCLQMQTGTSRMVMAGATRVSFRTGDDMEGLLYYSPLSPQSVHCLFQCTHSVVHLYV